MHNKNPTKLSEIVQKESKKHAQELPSYQTCMSKQLRINMYIHIHISIYICMRVYVAAEFVSRSASITLVILYFAENRGLPHLHVPSGCTYPRLRLLNIEYVHM